MKQTTRYKGAKFRVDQIVTASIFISYWLREAHCTGVEIG